MLSARSRRDREEDLVNARNYVMATTLALFSVGLAAQESAAPDTSSELIEAVRNGDAKVVTKLLTGGADAKAVTDGGMPLVAYAAMKGNAAIVDALVKAGADVNAKDRAGATALMYAAQFKQPAIVKSLIAAGADVNATDNLKWTPLIRAAVGGDGESTKALLEAGADKNAKDFFGRTALQVAEGRNHQEVVAALQG
jgi:ankyrin repeat protein